MEGSFSPRSSQGGRQKELGAVLTAAGQTGMICAGAAVLLLVFWWDAASSRPFTENAPTELMQSCVLALCALVFFVEAWRRPGMRRALILTGGLMGCMLIREQDLFLDAVSHGFWKWPAFTLAAACILYALSAPSQTISALSRLTKTRGFPTLLTGVVIVLFYSRILGTGILWKTLLPDGGWRLPKCAAEESSELLGYMLILFSACLLRLEHKNTPDDRSAQQIPPCAPLPGILPSTANLASRDLHRQKKPWKNSKRARHSSS